ncbi:hypothetical protein [Rubrobacter calidifluminis]|uniref:hypothetical protein n=1 Tax=Rubrobacter calidifluminis TaxID=1392640 RepID=UPI0023626E2B|nr:hypothetical protein [Rubrobacter calidifluminis]
MATLSYRQRKKLPPSAFVFPKEKRYPIHDKAHARNALARVAQHGTPAEQAAVKKAVYSRYPELDPKRRKKAQAKRAARKRLARNTS